MISGMELGLVGADLIEPAGRVTFDLAGGGVDDADGGKWVGRGMCW